MGFSEDFSIYTNTDEMGVVATVGGVSVDVLFDHEYVDIDLGNVQIAGENPVITGSESDLGSVAVGTTVIVNSTTYITRVPPKSDGTGETKLILEEQ